MINEILELLSSGHIRVIFRRREDNTIRNLLCTLKPSDIPNEQIRVLSSIIGSGLSDRVIVWDLEKNDWRSFYTDSVIDVVEVKEKREETPEETKDQT